MGRKKLGKVGVQTGAGLACPRCGGTQFTAKRSKKGKAIGVVTVGVGVVAAPKSQVKCVTCGEMFKRGGHASGPITQAAQQPPPPAPAHTVAPGWYPDPTGRHELRWHGGISWTDTVRDGPRQTEDPLG